MMADKFAQLPMRRSALAETFARLMVQSRFDRLRAMPLLHRFAAGKAIQKPDPVLLAVLAIDRVGPAAVRACASGVEVRVAAPDEATARVLRAALSAALRPEPVPAQPVLLQRGAAQRGLDPLPVQSRVVAARWPMWRPSAYRQPRQRLYFARTQTD